MPTQESTAARVIEIVEREIGRENVQRHHFLVADLECDSLDIVEVVMELEEEFDVEMPDEEVEKMETVGHMIDWITEQLAALK